MDSSIVPSDVGRVIANLERVQAALAECQTDTQRLYIRDQAAAAQAAAEVLKLRDIQTAASLLVQEAERAIAKANPPEQGRRNDLKDFVPAENEVTGLRKMRLAHSLSDEKWDARKAEAMATQTPVTRAGLISENKGKAKPKPNTITIPVMPTKTSRRLPTGGKVEVRIFPDGGVTVERLGHLTEWVVNISPDGLIKEATATGAADTVNSGRLIKLKEVREITGLGKSTIYRKMTAGEFPAPVKTGMRSVAWRADQIQQWLDFREQSDAGRTENKGGNHPAPFIYWYTVWYIVSARKAEFSFN